MSLLHVEQLNVTFPATTIIDRIDFQLEVGQIFGLVGESGCGKSMTALALMGLLPRRARTDGKILLQGQDLLSFTEPQWCQLRGKQIAMIFQEPLTALNPVKTIGAQISEGLRLHLGLNQHEADRRCRSLLDRVGLPPARFSPQLYPHQLSGGQRQRVVIAIALACEPQILIADEPTTALDVMVQQQIMELLAGLVGEKNMALLLITHDLAVVAEYAEKMAVMYSGRIVETGAVAEIFFRRAHPYTEGLLQALPQFDWDSAPKTPLATISGRVPEPSQRPPGCVFSNRCMQRQNRCTEQPPTLTAINSQQQAACYFPLHTILDQ